MTPGSRSCDRMWPPVMGGAHGGRDFKKEAGPVPSDLTLK